MQTSSWSLAVVSLFIPFAIAMAQSPKITGAINFRDLGGLHTTDGRILRTGMIFRSGELNRLTESDLETLADLKIAYVFDLRTDAERKAAPTNWSNNIPVTIPISVGFDPNDDPTSYMKKFFASGFGVSEATTAMQTVTAKIAIDGAPEIGRILRLLGRGEEPTILHCTAGKDRTGVVTALLLSLLGVSKDDLYTDYLRSNSSVQAQLTRLNDAQKGKSGMPSSLSALPIESIKVLMGVDRSFLDAAFTAIDARYGSFENYVKDGLKITPADREALRAHLLTSHHE